jgi:DNA-binding transcriptional LysR family regulator
MKGKGMVSARIRRYFRHGRLSQLAVFEAAARLGCYTRAARELHLAQPTVSAQIKKLTEALGLPLFEQVGKRMHLTHAGRSLQAACGQVLETFVRLEIDLASLRTLETGRLSIAASTGAQRLASRLVADFARLHPALEIALHVENRQALLERMARDDDDLYLLAAIGPAPGAWTAAPHDLVSLGVEEPVEDCRSLCYLLGKAPAPAAQAFLDFARKAG